MTYITNGGIVRVEHVAIVTMQQVHDSTIVVVVVMSSFSSFGQSE